MTVLGIETSCDETSVAIVKDGRQVLSNIIASQVDLHAPFGGVVPEIAARRHIECIGFIADEAISKAGMSLEDIDAFAVANGPGLAGALLVGLNYAKGLAFVTKKPLVGVHHIEGHVCANFLDEENFLEPPFMALVVSGGHTLILAVEDYNSYRVVGSTRDDAAGEAFDKVARVLGLPYPGGPEIDKIAKGISPGIVFPRAKVDGFDFSFSGLKTAVMQYIAREEKKGGEINKADIAASFQKAVVDVLAERVASACESEGFDKIALAGGVACNNALREKMHSTCIENDIQLYTPKPVFCTDNAAMIASRGYYRLLTGKPDGLDLNAFPGRMV
ncbi:MAG: tRNA (adenosine(37)-N6)-threonylcarbamoyltransferase complex transferase subunit TsaD [Defluviitaleaceae bacterium]|nr:tRNA (adenosine(37)-N6)-threonylcarbamoyltransferase complex transferase subunit TsaD [Defluviitaleaceae bacterium]